MFDKLALPRRQFLRAAALGGAGAGFASIMPAWAQPVSPGLVRPVRQAPHVGSPFTLPTIRLRALFGERVLRSSITTAIPL